MRVLKWSSDSALAACVGSLSRRRLLALLQLVHRCFAHHQYKGRKETMQRTQQAGGDIKARLEDVILGQGSAREDFIMRRKAGTQMSGKRERWRKECWGRPPPAPPPPPALAPALAAEVSMTLLHTIEIIVKRRNTIAAGQKFLSRRTFRWTAAMRRRKDLKSVYLVLIRNATLGKLVLRCPTTTPTTQADSYSATYVAARSRPSSASQATYEHMPGTDKVSPLTDTSWKPSSSSIGGVVWNPHYAVHSQRLEGIQRAFTRHLAFISPGISHRTNLGVHAPLNRMCKEFNTINSKFDNLDIFSDSFAVFRNKTCSVLECGQAVATAALQVLLAALQRPQSVSVLQHMLATVRSLIIKLGGACGVEGRVCRVVLAHCGAAHAASRAHASATLYTLMRTHYTLPQNFSGVKMQMTMSLSSLVGTRDTLSEHSLRRALRTMLTYAEHDQDLAGTSFPEQVKDLVFNLHMILSDTVKMKEFQQDPEMLLDLMHRIARGYQHSPDLRLTWLSNMAQKHMEVSVKVKEFQQDPEMLLDLMHRIARGYQHSPDLRLTWLSNMAQKHMEVSVKMKEFQQDPEMLLDLMHRIARGYQHSPDLRLTWLSNMAQKHMEVSVKMKEFQ
ncbi:unnamed protein product [Plutella xylostella]|uniref:(diamondback moth) hypothetical protein n=1 Tax=Plutella xylostella TaxID=51655 RepID=A0A8S4F146_PLUXY|nr:unnamed protein product [Plutella xylostella]